MPRADIRYQAALRERMTAEKAAKKRRGFPVADDENEDEEEG